MTIRLMTRVRLVGASHAFSDRLLFDDIQLLLVYRRQRDGPAGNKLYPD